MAKITSNMSDLTRLLNNDLHFISCITKSLVFTGPGFDDHDLDTISYAKATEKVTIDLADVRNNPGAASGDQYTSSETFVGSSFGDTFNGNSKAGTIDGGKGEDVVDLRKIDANADKLNNNAFKLVAGSGPLKTGELHYYSAGKEPWLVADVDGDKRSDFTVKVDSLIKFTADDCCYSRLGISS